MQPQNTQPTFLYIEEAAYYLNITTPYLYRMATCNGLIPYAGRGRKIIFTLEDLDTFNATHLKSRPTNPIENLPVRPELSSHPVLKERKPKKERKPREKTGPQLSITVEELSAVLAKISTLLKKEEVCVLLRLSLATLSRYMKEGQIKYYKLSTHVVRFKKEDLLEFCAAVQSKSFATPS